MKKRILAMTLCAALALSLLAACSDRAAQESVIPTDPAVTDGPLGDPCLLYTSPSPRDRG